MNILKILIYSLLITIFYSCGNNNVFNQEVVPTIYAPENIYTKTLVFDGSETMWNFNSSGTYSRNALTGTLYGTPTYSYTKIDSKTAKFNTEYVEKHVSGYSTWYFDTTYNMTLTFDSKTSGSYSGSLIMKSTGSIVNTQTTTSHGSFSLN